MLKGYRVISDLMSRSAIFKLHTGIVFSFNFILVDDTGIPGKNHQRVAAESLLLCKVIQHLKFGTRNLETLVLIQL